VNPTCQGISGKRYNLLEHRAHALCGGTSSKREITMRTWVMDPGLQYLSQHTTIPADERRIIGEIKNFKEWRLAVQHDEAGALASGKLVSTTNIIDV
jgi:hypothetical protein